MTFGLPELDEELELDELELELELEEEEELDDELELDEELDELLLDEELLPVSSVGPPQAESIRPRPANPRIFK